MSADHVGAAHCRFRKSCPSPGIDVMPEHGPVMAIAVTATGGCHSSRDNEGIAVNLCQAPVGTANVIH